MEVGVVFTAVEVDLVGEGEDDGWVRGVGTFEEVGLALPVLSNEEVDAGAEVVNHLGVVGLEVL